MQRTQQRESETRGEEHPVPHSRHAVKQTALSTPRKHFLGEN